ncbi:MAG: long-chain-fatty-acid--CoA ligase [Desulfobacteraceae bacterium]|nr:MAG: long-chain-fatty-acid--CoA ligase [Desulfobacteraceae bacterium]
MNLGSYFLEKAVAKYPDTISVVSPEARLTNRRLYENVCRLANALLGLGLKKGTRVGVLLTNSHHSVECFLGLSCAGLVLVPMNARNSAKEHAFILENSGAQAIIMGHEFIDDVQPVIDANPDISHAVCVGGRVTAPVLDYSELLARSSAQPPAVELCGDDISSIRYTAGTTGRPKGVVHTFGSNIIKVYNMLMDGYPIEEGDAIILTAPVTHASGTSITPHIVRGARVIILPKFEPEALMQTIEKERATTLYMVPTMLVMLLNHARINAYDLSSIKTIRYGASPIATDTLKKAIARFGHVFVQGYGLTEAGMPMTILSKQDHVLDGSGASFQRLKSIGREVTVANVRVVDENDRILPPGQIGEIVVRSDQMMQAYWKNPQATAETLRNGWLHTRDLGYRDEAGYFYLVDRKNDMIVSGGFNVYPKEVEEVLYMHPAVLEAAVFGVPDTLWGEAVKAVVSLKQEMTASETEIIEHCKAHLGGYKCPKSVSFMPELPKSAVGKILRRLLKDPYWRKEGRNIN